jgi:hypothetical protein
VKEFTGDPQHLGTDAYRAKWKNARLVAKA